MMTRRQKNYEISDILHIRGQLDDIVKGDFKTNVGAGATNEVVGPFGLGRRGEMLINVSRQHDLLVMSTCFKK